ncbi:MAG: type I DNA topoisomerase [Chloroflexota bacterium]|nr:type I DNA topoisomerase [Chloroflexota bacterium]
MQAYCLKCKTKREMKNPEPTFTKDGRPGTRGTYPVCGAKMFRMGETEAHKGLPRPEPPEPDGQLVIVESPAKARTIGRFLGKDYEVKASVGHVRDLLKSRLAVDVENDFKPTYRVPNEKRDVVKELKAAAAQAAAVYLATDPDREGEAIAWHLLAAVDITKKQARRVVFHEITGAAIRKAFSHPRHIDMRLVNAQQARRILDRLVGYKISPLLWKKVKGGLSAGRVQSVALRLVVEREREREAFVPQEYWTIEADLAKRDGEIPLEERKFRAKLHRIRGEKVDLKNEIDTQKIVEELEGAAYTVGKVRKRKRRRRPRPPFTTSTMQRKASSQLHFNTRRTMRVAQQLYEGIELDGETVGLITYMRTDSTNVAESAQQEARDYVQRTHGEEFLPPQPPRYKTKAKGAQEAHEAIRPTSVWRTPSKIKRHLSRDQHRLYRLIWRRFVASQMAPALLETTSVDVLAGLSRGERPYLFRATGSMIKFPGWLVLFKDDEDLREQESILPPLEKGEKVDLLELIPEQHFTQPPPRYSEATLVKALEEHGIGRPSTYAPIISTIQSRSYVERAGSRLRPTELGTVVCDLLVEHFPNVMDVSFTAQMEEDLDRIAAGEREWVSVLREFWGPFQSTLRKAERNMQEVDINQPTGEMCPRCGAPLLIKWGRYGKFIGCSNFPECRFTKPYLEKIGVQCPKCGGDIVKRKTRKGRTFYGCSNYPDCDFASWKRPLPTPCPECGGLLVKSGRDSAQCTVCKAKFPLREVEPVNSDHD